VLLGASCAHAPWTPPSPPALARTARVAQAPHKRAPPRTGALSAKRAGSGAATRNPCAGALSASVAGVAAGTRSTSRTRRRARWSRACWASGCAARCCGSRRLSWRGARRGPPGALAAWLGHLKHCCAVALAAAEVEVATTTGLFRRPCLRECGAPPCCAGAGGPGADGALRRARRRGARWRARTRPRPRRSRRCCSARPRATAAARPPMRSPAR